MLKITRNVQVPTGNIYVAESSEGRDLEFLSIGDYGKDANLKADFMGLSRTLDRVDHQEIMPLEKKWVVTISTQYGCSMGCTFCDVPKVGPGRNISKADLFAQINTAILLRPEIEHTERLNIHYARMGEPTWNNAVLEATPEICDHFGSMADVVHPVVSTMMPRYNKELRRFLRGWMAIKNNVLFGDAGLQISVNSTSYIEREEMFNGNALPLAMVSDMVENFDAPQGRKITLNFALAGYEIDAKLLSRMFDSEKCLVKLTPMHKTASAIANSIETKGDYTSYAPYQNTEEELKEAGFDVIVFLASKEEDESRITCGNAILID